jgi:hypothetical protein
MSQYRRHMDHEWRTAMRETNYSLFGNTRGDTVAGNVRYHSTSPTREEWRQERRRIKHAVEAVRVRCKCTGWSERAEALAWLRWTEGAA